jgi:hypothetical protein
MTGRGVLGLVLLVVGGGIAAISYFGAEPGESYFIWWGLPLVGAIMVFRDLSGRR